AQGLARAELALENEPGGEVADHDEVAGAAGRDVRAADRVAVHGGVVGGRHVEGRGEVVGEDARGRARERHQLRRQRRADAGEDLRLPVAHRDHARIIRAMNGPASDVTHPAGFWVRLAAFVLDLIVIGIAQLLLRALAVMRFGANSELSMSAVGFFTVVFAIAYPTVLHAIAGETVGKLVTRVHVVALDGGPLPL